MDELPEPPAWTVTVDPLTFTIGFAHVQVERRLAERWSVYVGPAFDHEIDGTGVRGLAPAAHTNVGWAL